MEINKSPSFSTMSTPPKSSGGVVEKNDSSSASSPKKAEISLAKQAKNEEPSGTKNARKEIESSQNTMQMREEMVALAKEMNRSLNPLSTSVHFEFGEDIGGLYINVIDATTDTVIRRFPSEEAVRLSVKMKELVGMMFDKTI